ncbi:NACHT domain-containing protein [Streptomyces triculaminicus]|uniref:NACHT domain-containing protein n=1 Tax=Streptomyces triculaminicus TaxID=2816232 RepID=UPI0037BDEA19
MRYKRQIIWGTAAVVAGTVFTMAMLSEKRHDVATLTSVLGFAVSVIGLAASQTREPSNAETAPSGQLDQRSDQLAAAVSEQWQAEWRLRRLQDPDPLQVSWAVAEPWLSDRCDNADDPPLLGDRLENIVEVFDRVPSKRLVILGTPGSGKTVLAVGFTLDMLHRRQPGDAVPVIFSLSGWRPDRRSLRDWMAASLAVTYPGATWAGELLAAGRVLPVLDGLDEIPEPLRAQAVQRLNAELDPGDPVLLTCRTEVYASEVETGDVFTAASAVELQPLSFEDASAYLIRTARPVRGAEGQRTTRWDPVIAHLHAHPDEPAGKALRQVLQTPLMIAMARTVYSEGEADPADLLHARYSDAAALEQHLLDAFVPAAFKDQPDASNAQRWLGFLATHLERQHTRDLAWWNLRFALPQPLRTLGPILLLGGMALVFSLSKVPNSGPGPVIATTAFIAAICVGYLILSHGLTLQRPRSSKRLRLGGLETLSALTSAALLGAIVGATSTLDFRSGYAILTDGWVNLTALAAATGLMNSVLLAIVGITGSPRPSTSSIGRQRSSHSPVYRFLITASLASLGASTILIVASSPLLDSQTGNWAFYLFYAGTILGILTCVLIIIKKRTVRISETHSPTPSERHRRRPARTISRRVISGLTICFCLSITFSLAWATVLAARSKHQPDFPDGSVVHTLPNGTRYGITSDGWTYGRLPNGDKYVHFPGTFKGLVARDPDGSKYVIKKSSAKDTCYEGTQCTPFQGPIELHPHHNDYSDTTVRLPSGETVPDYDFHNDLPAQAAEWLFQVTPSRLFRSATEFGIWAGITIGLIGGIATGVYRWLIVPVDITRALSPLASLYSDRTTAVARSVTITLFGVVGNTLLTLLTPTRGAEFWAVIVWAPTGPLALMLSAWGWLVTTRLWLCARQQLPWRLMSFLEEAHKRGVLRQVGAIYQFRHARLQEQLSGSRL